MTASTPTYTLPKFLVCGDVISLVASSGKFNKYKKMLVYKFVGMSVRGKGFPTKVTNIGPPRTIVILEYLSLVTF